jgi:hypothetical protein
MVAGFHVDVINKSSAFYHRFYPLMGHAFLGQQYLINELTLLHTTSHH